MSFTGKGRCFCRGIRLHVNADPICFVVCHCRDCQYVSGGGPACFLVVSESEMHIEDTDGLLGEYHSTADSGRKVTRCFCTRCGTPMFDILEADPTMRLVKTGALDDPSSLAVDVTCWIDSAQPWAPIESNVVLFGGDVVFPFNNNVPYIFNRRRG